MSQTTLHNPNTVNEAAVVTLATSNHLIKSVGWSLDAAPGSPILATVSSGGTIVDSWWITAAGDYTRYYDDLEVLPPFVFTVPAAGAAVKTTATVEEK